MDELIIPLYIPVLAVAIVRAVIIIAILRKLWFLFLG